MVSLLLFTVLLYRRSSVCCNTCVLVVLQHRNILVPGEEQQGLKSSLRKRCVWFWAEKARGIVVCGGRMSSAGDLVEYSSSPVQAAHTINWLTLKRKSALPSGLASSKVVK